MGLWPVGGWVTLVLGNLAQSAYSPPGGGLGSGWVGGWVGGSATLMGLTQQLAKWQKFPVHVVKIAKKFRFAGSGD